MIRRYDLVLVGGKTVELIIDTDKKQLVLGEAEYKLQERIQELMVQGHARLSVGWETEDVIVDGFRQIDFTSAELSAALGDELAHAGVVEVVEK